MLYIIIWLIICVIILSYTVTALTSKGTKNKRWHIITFITSWLIGLVSPIIFIIDLFKNEVKE